MIDLHIHTDASSDGVHSPREVFDMARAVGIRALAFADHNSTANVDEGLRLSKDYSIPFVPAIEISSGHRDQDVHLLGYFVDHRSSVLTDFLTRCLEESALQTGRRVELLSAAGFVLDTADVLNESAGRPPTGTSFLSALIKRPENRDNESLARYTAGDRCASPSLFFYQDYLAGGRPAYVPLAASATGVVIELIRAAGGIPILAHPGAYPDSIVREVIDMGVLGLEAYSGYHDAAASARFAHLCRRHALLITAGSDFHGKAIKPDIELGVAIDNGYEIYIKLKEAHRKIHAQTTP
jgi:3',5'-nucleoside bisphosphate phosphatase